MPLVGVTTVRGNRRNTPDQAGILRKVGRLYKCMTKYSMASQRYATRCVFCNLVYSRSTAHAV